MAVIKLAEDKSNPSHSRVYTSEQDVRVLVDYVLRKSQLALFNNIDPFNPDCIANQIIFIQRCRGKDISNRMIHLILSFDTYGFESHIDIPELEYIMNSWISMYFTGYQSFICLHTDKPNHLHVHFIINPVCLENYQIARYNLMSLKYDMAYWLSGEHQIAVQGINYYNGEGKLCKGNESGKMLYQDKVCKKFGLDKRAFL